MLPADSPRQRRGGGEASCALRISPRYYNTKDEIDTVVDALAELIDSK